MYVPVKGGEAAVAASRDALARTRRGAPSIPELTVDQIREQMRLAVDRVMTEGALYDPDLAALALKQAQGDIAEAVFLLRAHRATLRRVGCSRPIDFSKIRYDRHISATSKEITGGQTLGATYDYTHRLLDFSLRDKAALPELAVPSVNVPDVPAHAPASSDFNDFLNLDRQTEEDAVDITRVPLRMPCQPSETLAHLVRGEEGFLTGLAYAHLRTAGASHPYVLELSAGEVEVFVELEDIGLTISIGDLQVTACSMVSPVVDGKNSHLSEGFGVAFGSNERKAVAMAAVDVALKDTLDGEFVLGHSDGVEASGYVSHLKLPHYSDFQADLETIRRLRAGHDD